MKRLGQCPAELHQFRFDHKKWYDRWYNYSYYLNVNDHSSDISVVNNELSEVKYTNTNDISIDFFDHSNNRNY